MGYLLAGVAGGKGLELLSVYFVPLQIVISGVVGSNSAQVSPVDLSSLTLPIAYHASRSVSSRSNSRAFAPSQTFDNHMMRHCHHLMLNCISGVEGTLSVAPK